MRNLLLLAVLFDDVDPQQVAAALSALPGVSAVRVDDLRREGGPARIEFQLASRSQLPAIAGLEGVRWIEEVAEQNEDNGNSAGTIQSGTPGHGAGLGPGASMAKARSSGVIDSGPVDMNHCMFAIRVNNTPGAAHRKVLEVRGTTVSGMRTFVAASLGATTSTISAPAATGETPGPLAWCRVNAEVHVQRAHVQPHPGRHHSHQQLARRHRRNGNPATYNQTAADADTFTWNNEDHLVLGSMGNNGEEQGPPGTAKNADRRQCAAATPTR